ncbi:hypothetical protein, partial [Bacillus sp. S1-R2T1-FB]|uniref:hypothetical protein n=1 Tax=Bacillus sp. S1-R2T1-FB TaxID=1973493 RepID=UPI001C4F53D1
MMGNKLKNSKTIFNLSLIHIVRCRLASHFISLCSPVRADDQTRIGERWNMMMWGYSAYSVSV